MCAKCHMARYLFKMKLHGLGVSLRQREACTSSTRRTDRTKQISIGITLVSRLSWSCAAFCPLPHDAVLLANPRLVPRLREGRLWNQTSIGVSAGRCSRWVLSVCVKFFKCRHGFGILTRTARAGADVAEAQLLQKCADMAFLVVHVIALFDHPLQINPAPADNTINLAVRSSLDQGGEFSLLQC